MKKLVLLAICCLVFSGCGKAYDKVTVCESEDKKDIVTLYSKNDNVYLLESEILYSFNTISEAIEAEKDYRETMTTGKDDPKKVLSITRENQTVSILLKNYAYEESYKEALQFYESRSYSCKEK